jgi:hypothetical protein
MDVTNSVQEAKGQKKNLLSADKQARGMCDTPKAKRAWIKRYFETEGNSCTSFSDFFMRVLQLTSVRAPTITSSGTKTNLGNICF